MGFKTGVVEAVSIKPLAEEAKAKMKYPKDYKGGLKIGDEWFDAGLLNKEAINVKVGDDWHQISKGDELEFMYEENGKWNPRIDKKTIKVKSKGDGSSAPSSPSSSPSQSKSAQPSGSSFVNPAALGNAGNYLMHSLEYKHEDMMDDEKVLEGLIKYHKSRQQLSKFWEKAKKFSAEEEKTEEAPFENEEDDEI